MAQSNPIRIGTRGSPLALAQAGETRARLMAAHGLGEDDFEIAIIRTSGDRILDRPLAEVGGKGLFTKEIEEALLEGRIDLAVHSAKDMPTILPDGLVLAAFLEREDVRDVFLSPQAGRFEDLPRGALVGTASLRRQALVRRLRPDLRVASLRGNVQTRLAKLEAGEAAATLLALAGLKRLGMADMGTVLDSGSFPPALGQGAITIETRAEDARIRALLAPIDHGATHLALLAERALLDALDGSCRTPIAGLARIERDRLHLRGLILRPDGSEAHETARECAPEDGARAGREAGLELKSLGGPGFFAQI